MGQTEIVHHLTGWNEKNPTKIMYHLIGCRERHSIASVTFLPKMHDLNLITRKYQKNTN